MVIVEDAESDREDLSGGDDKGREMLFELFDHAIDEHLAHCAQDAHDQHVQHEDLVRKEEPEDVHGFEEDAGVKERDDEGHLFISAIIYMGSGLYSDLISAWKSGRKPSASRETINKKMPMISIFFSSLLMDSGSNALNMMIPIVMIPPTTIFLVPSFNFLSLTREQSTPTKMTEIRLQDLNIMTTGKLVR